MSYDKPATTPPPISSDTPSTTALITLPTILEPWKPTLLSYTASIGSVAGGYPLDSIKSRMQTQGFNSITKCTINALQHEGIRGLFRGISSPLFTIAFSRSINVSVFSFVKPSTSQLSLGLSNLNNIKPIFKVVGDNLPGSFLAGYSAGFFTSLWACPFEFVKLYSQISFLENKSKIGNIEALRQIWNFKGPSGLYTGYKFQFLRDTTGAAIYFTSYESFKLILNSMMRLNSENNDSTSSILNGFSSNWLSIALAGGLSGSLCWISIFPFDTLKSLQQKTLISMIIRRDSETIDSLRLRTNMYRGVGASVLRSFFTSMIFFSGYEYLMKIIN